MSEAVEEQVSVLVVEDDHALADLYADWLGESYDVTTAYTSEEAFDRLTEDIDVAIVDRRLPRLSGDEIIERIIDRDLEIQVAIVSAVTPNFAVIGLGIEDYLVKPVKRDELVSLIDRMVQRASYTDTIQELERLRSTKATIEAEMSENELEDREEYDALMTEITELEAQADALADESHEETNAS